MTFKQLVLRVREKQRRGGDFPQAGNLLAEEDVDHLENFIFLGQNLRLSLLKWSKEERSYVVCGSKIQKLVVWVYALYSVCYDLNMLMQYVVKQRALGDFTTDAAIHLTFSGAMIIWSLQMIEFLLHAESYADMFNCFLHLNRGFNVHAKGQTKRRLTVKILFKTLSLMYVVQLFACGLPVIADWNNTRYTCHYFVRSTWLKLGCLPIELGTLSIVAFFVTFDWNLLLIAVPTALNVYLENEKNLVEAFPKRDINMSKFLHRYKILYVFVHQFSCMMRTNYLVFAVFNIFSHTLCIYATVDFKLDADIGGRIVFAMYVVIWLVFEIVVYYVGGKIHGSSLELLGAIRRRLSRSKYERKVFAGCRPIGIQLGGFLQLKKWAPMYVIFIVSNVSINVLLLN